MLFAWKQKRYNRACSKAMRPTLRCQRWSYFPEQNGGLAKVDSGFDYAANFSWVACVA